MHDQYSPLTFQCRLRAEAALLLRLYRRPRHWLGMLQAFGRLVLRVIALMTADGLAACSEFVATCTDIPRTIAALPNPISLSAKGTQATENRPAILPRGFVFVGRLVKDKGCDTLIEAAALLKDCEAPIDVVVIGDGEERLALEQLAEARKISQRVLFTGAQPRAVIDDFLANSLALVCPVRWEDPAPYPPLEAAANHRISIASTKGGLPETAGPHALYFNADSSVELAARMRQCLDDPLGTLDKGRLAHIAAKEKYDAAVAVDRLLEYMTKFERRTGK